MNITRVSMYNCRTPTLIINILKALLHCIVEVCILIVPVIIVKIFSLVFKKFLYDISFLHIIRIVCKKKNTRRNIKHRCKSNASQ